MRFPTQRLKTVATINDDKLDEDTEPDFEFRYVDIGSVGHGILTEQPELMTFATAPSRARRRILPGDTLVSTVRTYLRAVWPIHGETSGLVASTGFAVIRPHDIHPRFAGWLLQSDTFIDEVVARSVGVSYPAINPGDLGELRVPVPANPNEQLAIANFLDNETTIIDDLIGLKQQFSTTTSERYNTIVSAGTHAFATVALNADRHRILPDGWTSLRIARCLASAAYGVGEASRPSGEIAVLGMGNVDDCGQVVGEPGGYIDIVSAELLIRPGDLLFNRTNSLEKVGKVALVASLSEPTTVASYLVIVRVNEFVDPGYLNYALNAMEVLTFARTLALPSIGQANLNPSRWGNIIMALPPLDEQRRIRAEIQAEQARVDDLRASLNKQIALLRERRQALITAAVDGELQIA